MTESLFDDAFLRKIELLHLASKRIASGTIQAARRSKRLGAGVEVRDFRPYTAGDDLRHIDWNYFGSTRDLIVRLFEEEEDLHIYFLVDVSPSMGLPDGAKLRYAKRVAGALAYIGLSNLDRVSVVPFAGDVVATLPPSRGRSQIWKVFRFLDQEFAAAGTDARQAFRNFATRTSRPGLAVVISDFYDHGAFAEGLDALRYHRFEPLVVQVYDERDLRPSLKGDLEVVDCETGDTVRVTVTPGLLRRYAEAHEELAEAVRGYCRQKNVLHARAPVQLPFDELVLGVFRAGGFLR